MRKGRLTEAAECCRQALHLNPRLVSFHFSTILFLAVISFYVIVECSHLLCHAILAQVDAHSNLGNMLKAQGLTQHVCPKVYLL